MSSKKKQGDDQRFLRVQRDPRFWEMPERERKIKIDKRFQSMFHDKRFKVKYTVDKRGRPINHTSTEDLKRFYNISDSEEEEGEDEAEGKKATVGRMKEKKGKESKAQTEPPERGVRVIEAHDEEEQRATVEEEEEEEEEDDDDDLGLTDGSDDADEESEVASGSEEDESGLDSEDESDSGPDLARGKGNIETSSDEDNDDEEVDIILRKEEEEIQHDWGEMCKDAPRSEEVSARLAVCNMDWDRMKAKDLLALVNSFTTNGGAVLSVKIYPSEFGKERLKAEETQGPMELKALPEDSEDDSEEQSDYREKMRDYQFKRLKYFYAVVECDSVDTAAKIYSECDGYEYESSCSVLDLRFIPDDVMFEEEPKDTATDVNLAAFTPKLFTSSAATTSKVQLTWDETDHERVTAMNRNFNKGELLDMDFNAYLASSSDEEEEGEEGGVELREEENEEEEGDGDEESRAEDKKTETSMEEEEEKRPRQKGEKKKKMDQQISKYRELLSEIQDKVTKLQENRDMEMEITWVPGLKETTEQLVKKKLEGPDQPTPWEEFLEKKKDKKKQKKSQKKQGGNEEEEEEEEASDDELPPDVDLSDPFFAEELAGADVNKKQKKKKKQRAEEERTAEEEEELEKRKAEMALLMEDDSKQKHFNYDKIVEQQNLSKKKRKKLLKKGEEPLEDDGFQVDVKDPRFQAMFTSHLFNLDPSHPSYKNTTATKSILTEKQRRREEGEELGAHRTQRTEVGERDSGSSAAETGTRKTMDPNLLLLVKSIKSKTQQFQARKKQKLV